MPVYERIAGIRIVIRSREYDYHGAHFHALSGGRSASIAIGSQTVYASTLTSGELRAVLDWARTRQAELTEAYQDLQDGRLPRKLRERG